MLNIIKLTRILANTSHTHSVSVIAPQVLHENVGGIGLRRKAVVANINSGIRHAKPIHIQRIESISILGQRLRLLA